MAWISLLFIAFVAFGQVINTFQTKHAIESVRFISADGRYAYVTKKSGVLGLVSSFRNVDFISTTAGSDFLVKGSRFKKRLVVEVIANAHTAFNVVKNNKIMVVDFGNTYSREIGEGLNAKLHHLDEWASYYRPADRAITLKNLLTDKTYTIRLSQKLSPFFMPQVEMVSGEAVLYTDINEKGQIGLTQYNLATQRSTVIFRSNQSGTHLNVCSHKDYLAFGEFPYDDIVRDSSIMHVKLAPGSNLAGFTTLYSSSVQDIGSMVCTENSIYFIKTMQTERATNTKFTELAKLDLKTSAVKALTGLKTVTNVFEMDGMVLLPHRGEFYVIEGNANLSEDKLKLNPVPKDEELPLDI